MKHVTVKLLDPGLNRVLGHEIDVQVLPEADFLDVVAHIDEGYMRLARKATRGDEEIHSILQLVWDPSNNCIYDEDIGIEVRDADRNWIAVKRDPFIILPDDSTISLAVDPGC